MFCVWNGPSPAHYITTKRAVTNAVMRKIDAMAECAFPTLVHTWAFPSLVDTVDTGLGIPCQCHLGKVVFKENRWVLSFSLSNVHVLKSPHPCVLRQTVRNKKGYFSYLLQQTVLRHHGSVPGNRYA